jgi:putative oxidoreductase
LSPPLHSSIVSNNHRLRNSYYLSYTCCAVKGKKDMSIALWIVQGLLALAFLLAGLMKSFSPLENLKKNMAWVGDVPAGLVRFIGIVEILGALGLILPKLTKIVPQLTIAAAIGLVLVMLSAAVFHARRKEFSNIGIDIVLLLLAAFVAVGYLLWVPVA